MLRNQFLYKKTFNSKINSLLSHPLVFFIKVIFENKKYLVLNLSSSILSGLLEVLNLSLTYMLISLLSGENNKSLNLEKILFIGKFDFIINIFNSISFKQLFIFLIFCLLLIQVLLVLLRYINQISQKYMDAYLLSSLTTKIYSHIFSLTYKQCSRYKIGDLTAYITTLPFLCKRLTQFGSVLLLNIVISISAVFFILRLSLWNIFIFIFLYLFSNKLRETLFPKIRSFSSIDLALKLDLTKSIVENFQGLKFIYSNGLISSLSNKINADIHDLEKALNKTALITRLFPTLFSLGPLVVIAFTSIIYAVFSDESQLISSLGILLIAIQRLNVRITGAANALGEIKSVTPKINRVVSFLNKKGINYRRTGGKVLKPPFKEITFSKIYFKHSNKEKFGLNDINFTLRSGEKTAIVGFSGAGKSSILDLLIGLYEANSGDIFINGESLKELNIEKWQQQISIVSQDTFLINSSISDNLNFGIRKKSFKDIKKACMASGADKFIKNLPDGYDTIIGDRGFKLSGAERQRLSIAKAILKKSSLLILDEATSALDSQNEKFVVNSLDKTSSNVITIIVTHRLSTIKNADNILVLNKGEIVESGNHQFLLDQNGIYSKFWNIQSKE